MIHPLIRPFNTQTYRHAPFNTPDTPLAHALDTSSNASQKHPFYRPSQHLSTHPINPPSTHPQPTLSTSTLSTHTLSTHLQHTPNPPSQGETYEPVRPPPARRLSRGEIPPRTLPLSSPANAAANAAAATATGSQLLSQSQTQSQSLSSNSNNNNNATTTVPSQPTDDQPSSTSRVSHGQVVHPDRLTPEKPIVPPAPVPQFRPLVLDGSRFEEAFPNSNPSSAFSSPFKPSQQPQPQPQQLQPHQSQQQSPHQSPQQLSQSPQPQKSPSHQQSEQPPSVFDGSGHGFRGEEGRASPGLSRGPSTPMASEETRASLAAAVRSPITPMVRREPSAIYPTTPSSRI